MRFGVWQIIFIVICAMDLGISLVKHGDSRGYYSFWTTLISIALNLLILYKGGFFG